LLYDVGRLAQLAQPSAQGTDLAALSEAFIRQHVPARLISPDLQDALRGTVRLADRLVAGGDEGQSRPQPHALLSVFCQIGEDPARRPQKAYLSLRPLALDEATLFPSAGVRGDAAAYAPLWQGLQGEAAKLHGQADAETYIESLYHVLRRYTWCVPSGADGVSLFDHSRVRAALAACLADLGEAEIENLLQHSNDTSRPLAYLVKGDVSGVQRFIYTLTSKGVAKGLRGRSFYLQLLNEAIARYLLREMELPITNLIYVGGGHFYLLVPPGEGERLARIRQALEDLLLKHHDGALYLALGHAELRAADFFQAREFSARWREAGGSVAEAKRRRFAHVPDLFEPRGHGGNEETECQVCHAERRDITRDEEEVRKCALCRSFEDLGGALGRSQVLALGQTAPVQQAEGRYEALLAELGFRVALLDDEVEKRLEGWKDVQRVTVLGLRDFPAAELCERVARALQCPVAAGVRYTANVTPHKGHQIATFEDLQEVSTGLKRLGVLRMDVDDLGYLFGQGFQGKENGRDRHLTTLARVAGLSSMMALFFEGWVGERCRQFNEENRDRKTDVLYTIYSGGDDLFIVGAWDVLPGLARTIRDDLGRFAAGNPYVHVSAGITLHGGKYPLYLAAEDAKGALDDAKDLPGKDALTFLGEAHHWNDWNNVDSYKNDLHGLVVVSQVGRSLLQVLQRMYAQYCDVRDALAERGGLRARNGHDQTVWGPYMWQSAYLLTRLAERVKGEVKEKVRNLRDQLSADNFRAIETVGLAARWAEALTRSTSHSKEGDK
jgi:CRISPR-associated protein Csm1